jgi:hypothetical protein
MTLVRANGTQITKTAGDGLIETQAESDPMVKVTVAVWKLATPSGTNYPPVQKMLKFHADQLVRKSVWDAEFPTATITSVSPATGAAAGGTAITIKGSGFTPGSTVTVGGNAATSVSVINDGKITCVTAAHTAGATNVVVTTDTGAVTKTGGFTFA